MNNILTTILVVIVDTIIYYEYQFDIWMQYIYNLWLFNVALGNHHV